MPKVELVSLHATTSSDWLGYPARLAQSLLLLGVRDFTPELFQWLQAEPRTEQDILSWVEANQPLSSEKLWWHGQEQLARLDTLLFRLRVREVTRSFLLFLLLEQRSEQDIKSYLEQEQSIYPVSSSRHTQEQGL